MAWPFFPKPPISPATTGNTGGKFVYNGKAAAGGSVRTKAWFKIFRADIRTWRNYFILNG